MRHELRIRTAREDDVERLIAIHMAAFPDGRNRDARRRNFLENMRGPLSDLYVAESGGALLAHAFMFRMASWFGGSELAVGGIASVGVAPEARGKGVARALMSALLAELQQRQTPLCLLYPFRHHFYGKLGFATVSEVKRVRIPTGALPTQPNDIVLRAATRPEDFALARRCYERYAEQHTGLIVRRETLWRALFTLEGRHLTLATTPGGEVVGYSMHGYLWPPEGMPQEIDVMEMIAETDSARLALYGFFKRQRDQSSYVRLLLDARDPLLAFVDEPRSASFDAIRTLIPIAGEVGAGAMLRMIDIPHALTARGYLRDGALSLRIHDRDTKAPLFSGTLRVEKGRAQIQPGALGPTLATDVATLTQLYAGYIRTADAVRYGRAHVDRAETLAIADALFDVPPFFTLDYF
ncbi:MAG: GNAT family N-acetyltransferase [Sandaracinaceae bacterium]|nr:GNAT family N-acetyltransferase [Sandaracinaceae bacterium]